MKENFFIALVLSVVFAANAMANECIQTCESEYNDCKSVAESATAKQACEDDVKSCKADCGE